MVYLGIWFLGQLWSGFADLGVSGAGIAFFAHIGGFLAGVVFYGIFASKRLVQIPEENGSWSNYRHSGHDDIWY